jgi:hypothetical protein
MAAGDNRVIDPAILELALLLARRAAREDFEKIYAAEPKPSKPVEMLDL